MSQHSGIFIVFPKSSRIYKFQFPSVINVCIYLSVGKVFPLATGLWIMAPQLIMKRLRGEPSSPPKRLFDGTLQSDEHLNHTWMSFGSVFTPNINTYSPIPGSVPYTRKAKRTRSYLDASETKVSKRLSRIDLSRVGGGWSMQPCCITTTRFHSCFGACQNYEVKVPLLHYSITYMQAKRTIEPVRPLCWSVHTMQGTYIQK